MLRLKATRTRWELCGTYGAEKKLFFKRTRSKFSSKDGNLPRSRKHKRKSPASSKGYADKNKNGNDGNHGNYVAPAVPRKDDAEIKKNSHNLSPIHQAFIDFLETRPTDICANIMICLTHQCNLLLHKQIAKLEQTFAETGGLRERMYNARKEYRNNN